MNCWEALKIQQYASVSIIDFQLHCHENRNKEISPDILDNVFVGI